MVTSKACNFIGNLCRHSDIFYLTLILPLNPNTHSSNTNTNTNTSNSNKSNCVYTPNPKYVFKHLLHLLLYCCCPHNEQSEHNDHIDEYSNSNSNNGSNANSTNNSNSVSIRKFACFAGMCMSVRVCVLVVYMCVLVVCMMIVCVVLHGVH